MENPEKSICEGLIVILFVIGCFGLTIYTRYKTKKEINKQKEERKQMAKELANIQNKLQ